MRDVRAELIASGVPYHAIDELAEAARLSFLKGVLNSSLEDVQERAQAEPWRYQGMEFPNAARRAHLQRVIGRMLPGERFRVDWSEWRVGYRKITTVEEAMFGPQISEIDYFRELNPDVDINLQALSFVLEITKPDHLGITDPSRWWSPIQECSGFGTKPYDGEDSSDSGFTVTLGPIQGSPLTHDEYDGLRYLKRRWLSDTERRPIQGMNRDALESLVRRGLAVRDRRIILSDLGKQFVGR